MKRTLCIIRHADAEEYAGSGSDRERHLTKAGISQCRQAAAFLERQDLTPDLVLASSARRARETAVIIQEVMGLPAGIARFEESAYNATANALLALVRAAPDDVRIQYLVAHNPGVSELSHLLTADAPGLGKADIHVIDFEAARWDGLGGATGKRRALFRPEP
ncbi:MAG: histidine phosphatase family protein [Spirochaetes bacterium]|nr:histidine phosphatase family protein [Spirochaetota bacterium]